MTKQEAIEILRDTPIDIRSTREDDIHTLYATAQGMAIEALQRRLETVNADSCSEKPNMSEPKTAENGSVEKEMPEIKADRTTGGMIYRQDAIDVAKQHWYKPDIAKALEELPSAQPERKKGKWVNARDGYDGHVKCNKCFKTYDWTSDAQYFKFCPNCGSYNGG